MLSPLTWDVRSAWLTKPRSNNNDDDIDDNAVDSLLIEKNGKPKAVRRVDQMKQFEKALLLLERASIRPRYEKVVHRQLFSWEEDIPEACWPRAGGLKGDRAKRKRWQIENMARAILPLARPGCKIVEFCGGSGFLCLPLAALLPSCTFIMVDMKERSVEIARERLCASGMRNVEIILGRIENAVDKIGKFDIGLSLHACGAATDIAMDICLDADADYVMCPCCVGKINSAQVKGTYPRSDQFAGALNAERQLDFMYRSLAAAADYGGRNVTAYTSMERRRRTAKSLVESDRNARSHETKKYATMMYVMEPRDASPKNDVIVGVAPRSRANLEEISRGVSDPTVEWLLQYEFDLLQNDPATRKRRNQLPLDEGAPAIGMNDLLSMCT